MIPKQRDIRGSLVNVLISEMKKEHYRERLKAESPPEGTTEAGDFTLTNQNEVSQNEAKLSTNENSPSKSDSAVSESDHVTDKDAKRETKQVPSDGTPV